MKADHVVLPNFLAKIFSLVKAILNPSMKASTFVILMIVMNAVLYNWPLASFSVKNLDGITLNSLHTMATVFAVIYLETALVFYLVFIISRRLGKAVCVIFALANSLAVYFVVTYNVILDKSMMGNIFNTQYSESEQFLSPKLLIYFVFFGVLPAFLILRTSLQKTSRIRLLIHFVVTLIITASAVWLSANQWLWIDKHAKQLGGMTMPWSYVGNSVRFYNQQAKENEPQTLLPDGQFTGNHKTVVVLVIGESARAQNFALYGYPRQTTPLLSKTDNLVTLQNATSCASYTTASVKCILSHVNPGVFSENFEPLPSYLQRQGVDVIWRTKNWGEAPIKVSSYLKSGDLRKNCEGTECNYDGVLLTDLVDQIQASDKQKVFVVLHQTGSHGPSYHSKYPSEFETFTPVCESVELNKCTPQELINAYDNTLVYNDHFLDQLRQQLTQLNDTQSAYLFVSDHGESLGEDGIYLHGTPYSIAPEQQLKVPFLVWMSDSFIQQHQVSLAKLKAREESTQANVFHSVLGALEFNSPIYNPSLDLFLQAKED